MRSIFLSFLLNPLLRHGSLQTSRVAAAATTTSNLTTTTTFSIPILKYPVCRRNFTIHYSLLKNNIGFNMADSGKEEQVLNGVEENEVSGQDDRIEEALKDMKVEERKEEKKEEPALPKLSAAEFRAYNSMAEHMEYFHQHFRHSWNLLYSACENNKRPAGYSLKQFIATGLQLVSSLTAHHNIEEMHIFPVLARKMPEFKQGHNAAELLRQHKEIHKGMDGFEEYLRKCRSGETEFELKILKTQMDTWGEVLWKHLDQEVKTLGAENMRKYWSVEEMRRMPM